MDGETHLKTFDLNMARKKYKKCHDYHGQNDQESQKSS